MESSHTHHNHQLSVENLHVHYGEICALRDISFKVNCGNALAIIGANGAGKSTLLKALAMLNKPKEGRMTWRGKPLKKSSYEIAYLPQREEVDWNFPLTVRELVEMGRYPHLGLIKSFTEEDHKIVKSSLNKMNLLKLENRLLRELSGGQQQRAFIARFLAQEAHILLLDEPFNNLDKKNKETLSVLLKNMRSKGHLVIASCHEGEIIRATFDYILKLECNVISYTKNPDFELEKIKNKK